MSPSLLFLLLRTPFPGHLFIWGRNWRTISLQYMYFYYVCHFCECHGDLSSILLITATSVSPMSGQQVNVHCSLNEQVSSQKDERRKNCVTGIPSRVPSRALYLPSSARPQSAFAFLTSCDSQITINSSSTVPFSHFPDESTTTQDLPTLTGLPGPWLVPWLDMGHRALAHC